MDNFRGNGFRGRMKSGRGGRGNFRGAFRGSRGINFRGRNKFFNRGFKSFKPPINPNSAHYDNNNPGPPSLLEMETDRSSFQEFSYHSRSYSRSQSRSRSRSRSRSLSWTRSRSRSRSRSSHRRYNRRRSRSYSRDKSKKYSRSRSRSRSRHSRRYSRSRSRSHNKTRSSGSKKKSKKPVKKVKSSGKATVKKVTAKVKKAKAESNVPTSTEMHAPPLGNVQPSVSQSMMPVNDLYGGIPPEAIDYPRSNAVQQNRNMDSVRPDNIQIQKPLNMDVNQYSMNRLPGIDSSELDRNIDLRESLTNQRDSRSLNTEFMQRDINFGSEDLRISMRNQSNIDAEKKFSQSFQGCGNSSKDKKEMPFLSGLFGPSLATSIIPGLDNATVDDEEKFLYGDDEPDPPQVESKQQSHKSWQCNERNSSSSREMSLTLQDRNINSYVNPERPAKRLNMMCSPSRERINVFDSGDQGLYGEMSRPELHVNRSSPSSFGRQQTHTFDYAHSTHPVRNWESNLPILQNQLQQPHEIGQSLSDRRDYNHGGLHARNDVVRSNIHRESMMSSPNVITAMSKPIMTIGQLKPQYNLAASGMNLNTDVKPVIFPSSMMMNIGPQVSAPSQPPYRMQPVGAPQPSLTDQKNSNQGDLEVGIQQVSAKDKVKIVKGFKVRRTTTVTKSSRTEVQQKSTAKVKVESKKATEVKTSKKSHSKNEPDKSQNSKQLINKFKSEFKSKLEMLKNELQQLQKQQGELFRKNRKEKDGHKDPLLIKNGKLQDDILKQIFKVSKHLNDLDRGIVPIDCNEDSEITTDRFARIMEQLDKKNLKSEYYDPFDHWCKLCNEVSGNLQLFLAHLKSKEHKQRLSPKDFPWSLRPAVKDPPKSDVETVRLEFKGSQFLVPAHGFYCCMCTKFVGDEEETEKHMKTDDHNHAYAKFIKQNRFFERRWHLEQSVGLDKLVRDKQKNLKQDTVKKSKDVNDAVMKTKKLIERKLKLMQNINLSAETKFNNDNADANISDSSEMWENTAKVDRKRSSSAVSTSGGNANREQGKRDSLGKRVVGPKAYPVAPSKCYDSVLEDNKISSDDITVMKKMNILKSVKASGGIPEKNISLPIIGKFPFLRNKKVPPKEKAKRDVYDRPIGPELPPDMLLQNYESRRTDSESENITDFVGSSSKVGSPELATDRERSGALLPDPIVPVESKSVAGDDLGLVVPTVTEYDVPMTVESFDLEKETTDALDSDSVTVQPTSGVLLPDQIVPVESKSVAANDLGLVDPTPTEYDIPMNVKTFDLEKEPTDAFDSDFAPVKPMCSKSETVKDFKEAEPSSDVAVTSGDLAKLEELQAESATSVFHTVQTFNESPPIVADTDAPRTLPVEMSTAADEINVESIENSSTAVDASAEAIQTSSDIAVNCGDLVKLEAEAVRSTASELDTILAVDINPPNVATTDDPEISVAVDRSDVESAENSSMAIDSSAEALAPAPLLHTVDENQPNADDPTEISSAVDQSNVEFIENSPMEVDSTGEVASTHTIDENPPIEADIDGAQISPAEISAAADQGGVESIGNSSMEVDRSAEAVCSAPSIRTVDEDPPIEVNTDGAQTSPAEISAAAVEFIGNSPMEVDPSAEAICSTASGIRTIGENRVNADRPEELPVEVSAAGDRIEVENPAMEFDYSSDALGIHTLDESPPNEVNITDPQTLPAEISTAADRSGVESIEKSSMEIGPSAEAVQSAASFNPPNEVNSADLTIPAEVHQINVESLDEAVRSAAPVIVSVAIDRGNVEPVVGNSSMEVYSSAEATSLDTIDENPQIELNTADPRTSPAEISTAADQSSVVSIENSSTRVDLAEPSEISRDAPDDNDSSEDATRAERDENEGLSSEVDSNVIDDDGGNVMEFGLAERQMGSAQESADVEQIALGSVDVLESDVARNLVNYSVDSLPEFENGGSSVDNEDFSDNRNLPEDSSKPDMDPVKLDSDASKQIEIDIICDASEEMDVPESSSFPIDASAIDEVDESSSDVSFGVQIACLDSAENTSEEVERQVVTAVDSKNGESDEILAREMEETDEVSETFINSEGADNEIVAELPATNVLPSFDHADENYETSKNSKCAENDNGIVGMFSPSPVQMFDDEQSERFEIGEASGSRVDIDDTGFGPVETENENQDFRGNIPGNVQVEDLMGMDDFDDKSNDGILDKNLLESVCTELDSLADASDTLFSVNTEDEESIGIKIRSNIDAFDRLISEDS